MRRGAERTSVYLRQPEGRVVRRDDDVGVPHEADAAAETKAVNSGDNGDLAVVDGRERSRAASVHPYESLVATRLDLLDVDPRAEPSAFGAKHGDNRVWIAAGRGDRVREGEPRRHVERVDRRDVDHDLGDPGPWPVDFDTHIAPRFRGFPGA